MRRIFTVLGALGFAALLAGCAGDSLWNQRGWTPCGRVHTYTFEKCTPTVQKCTPVVMECTPR